MTGADHVRPPSLDHDSGSVYASGSGPASCSQCATSVPSAIARTEGTSAAFATIPAPDATVSGLDHPAELRSANLRIGCGASGDDSSQLRRTRPPAAVS